MAKALLKPQDRNVLALLGVSIAGLVLPASAAAQQCRFLMPIGGNGNGPAPHIVKKQVQRPKGLVMPSVAPTGTLTSLSINPASVSSFSSLPIPQKAIPGLIRSRLI